MTYIRNGQVETGSQPLLRLSLIPDLFWGIVNFAYFLVATLFSVRTLSVVPAQFGTLRQ